MVKTTTTVVLTITCIAAVLTAFFVKAQFIKSTQTISVKDVSEYVQWKSKYRNSLMSTPEEEQFRLEVFLKNRQVVERKNKEYMRRVYAEEMLKPLSPMFELNLFADLTDEEFEVMYTGGAIELSEEHNLIPQYEYSSMKDYFKRRSKSFMTSSSSIDHSYRILNQSTCGSCWAFSSVHLAERLHYQSTGRHVSLSQQQLIDCDKKSDGCSGGLVSQGLDHINQYGVAKSSSYHYKGTEGACQLDNHHKLLKGKLKMMTFWYHENLLASWLRLGNYAGVRIYANSLKFASHSNDVYIPSAEECSGRVNHAAVLISENMANRSEGYFVLMNSWGEKWGNRGIKKIRPCSKDNFLGENGQFYTY